MEKSRLVEYKDDELDVKLTVQRADVGAGIYRSILLEMVQQEAVQPEIDDLRSVGVYIEHTQIYPSMIAGVAEAEGFASWPIGFEEYIHLPEQLVIAWENAVFQLNPHWKIEPADKAPTEDDQKKATTSSGA